MSFISVEPQSRVILKSHSNTLLSQFDTHLRIVADRYIAFFQERRSIEATYVDSLQKLHRKAAAVDVSFDARSEPSNTRVAWDKLRDNLANEASTQMSFVDLLDRDVINPLKLLKQGNDETRKRIHDDLKGSATKYADHAESRISKLQRAYLKKYHSLSQPLRLATDRECRDAVHKLNEFRWSRVESLRDGYDCLEELVFTPTIKAVLATYMDGLVTTCAKYGDVAMKTKTEVENVWDGRDTSDLRASFSRALSYSIPPLTHYRNYRPTGYSRLIFGVPLVDQTTSEDNVPKVVRMCIEEVEKRGLNLNGIYLVSDPAFDHPEVLELRRRFESEESFSFSSTDKVNSVAMLLRRYLWELPEPLLVLTSQDYSRNIGRLANTESDLSLLRSKIRELHPADRETLGALLRHFSRVASHSDKNQTKMLTLADAFWLPVLRRNTIPVSTKKLVMQNLIQNVDTLFDGPTLPSHVPSEVAETTPAHTHGSLFLSPELRQSTTQHPGLVGGIPTSTQLSLSSLPSDTTDSSQAPSPTGLLSPLLGLPSSTTLTEGVEAPMQEQVMTAAASGPEAVEPSTNSNPVEVVPASLTSVSEWRLNQSQLTPQLDAVTIPQSPPESVLSSTSDFPLSSATSLQTRML